VGGYLQQAKAANDRLAETPMDSRTRANYVETYRTIQELGTELQTRAATGEAEVKATAADFKTDYNEFVSIVTDFVKASNAQQPSAPPTVAPRVREPRVSSELPAPSMATFFNWTPWTTAAIVGGVALLGGLGYYGYKKGWFKARRRR
jgi:hypothetical protein